MKKNLFRWLIVLVVILPCLLSVSSAEEWMGPGYYSASGFCGDDLYWHIDGAGEPLIISGTGDMSDFQPGGAPWVSGENFLNYFWCEKVIVYDADSIGTYAFYDWFELKDVEMYDGLLTIGAHAFDSCPGLESVTIPATVTNIGVGAFANCYWLSEIIVDPNNTAYCSEDGVLYNKDKTELVIYPAGKDGEDYVIPNSVTSIADEAFVGSGLSAVTIPDNVITIGARAFSGCYNLSSVTIGDSVTTIGDYAFSGCSNLTSVAIGESVTTISDYAFSGCSNLTGVTIGDSVTAVGDYAFSNCSKLNSVAIGGSVTAIGDRAFSNCYNLTTIVVSDENTDYSDVDGVLCNKDQTQLLQFPGKKAEAYTIPDGVISIMDYAFYNCDSLTSVTIPDSVTTIGRGAFENCSGLTSVIIGNGVTIIWYRAFYSCDILSSMEFLGNAPTSVAVNLLPTNNSFDRCENLTIYCHEGTTGWTDSEYYDASDGTWCDYPLVMLPALREITASGYCGGEDDGTNLTWTLYADGELVISGSGAMADWTGSQRPPWYSVKSSVLSLTIDSGVANVGAYAFVDFDNLPSVSIPDGVISIGNLAFYDCNSLTSVTIPNGVTAIGDRAFQQCRSLGAIMIPDSVTLLGEYAFYWCNKLTSVSIGNGVTAISGYTFYNCQNLSSLTIGTSVSSIGSSAFYGCMYLTEVSLPDGVTSIGASAFKNCARLSSIIIPNSVATIGASAFYECISLTSVNLPDKLTTIEENTFYSCYDLSNVTIPNGVANINSSAFEYCTTLSNVVIPSSIEFILDKAFSNCTNLTQVKFQGKAPVSTNQSAFSNCSSSLKLYCTANYSTGWTSSKYYNASAGTWCGIPLVVIHTITDAGRTLSLKGEIFINMYIKCEGFDGIDIATAGGLLVWDSAVTEEDAVYGTQSYEQNGLTNSTYGWGAQTRGIVAKGYTDTIYLRMFIEVAEGEYVYGPLKEYSVQTYCQNQLNKSGISDQVKQLCAMMLHYGAAAQKAFNYNTGNLANANILDRYPAPAWMK